MMSRNLEYKAEAVDIGNLEREFVANGAVFKMSMHQVDTYFNVSRGRLKIRTIEGGGAELIFYEREEKSPDSMISLYHLAPIPEKGIIDILGLALNVKVRVEKVRRLLMLENARIHLDEVKNLGNFLEIEVVHEGNDHDDRILLQYLKRIAAKYIVRELNKSYSDLLLEGRESISAGR
ncbi:MAG: class IV adenylate cyclase [Candidatus Kryptoniota bacterium]